MTYEDFKYISSNILKEKLTDLDISGTKTTHISDNAFFDIKALVSVNLPSILTTIGGGAFSGCISLRIINIPVGLKIINGYLFYNCKLLSSITIPNGVTKIGFNTFLGCSSLTSIRIPQNVNKLGFFPFDGCTLLKTAVEIIYSERDESFDNDSRSFRASRATFALNEELNFRLFAIAYF